jgi:CRISPR-associated endonuclease/helicase Cas3
LPWAKLRRVDDPPPDRLGPRGRGAVVAWCALIDHSADVAAIFSAVLDTPIVAARLARLAGLDGLDETLRARLGVLAALHDFGKANHGFQNRWSPEAPPIGHVKEAWDGLCRDSVATRLFGVMPFEAVLDWGGTGPLAMALGHHGYPLDTDAAGLADGSLWKATQTHDPVASLAPLGAAIRAWYPAAFAASGTLPKKSPFWHLVSGLLTLADWIASDETLVPLSPLGFSEGEARFVRLRQAAPALLARIGFDPRESRLALPIVPGFDAISPYPARPIQQAAGETGAERILVLESETGSGKTEAALLRFARLFQAGEVDGLYFALPTRVAATALFHRVEAVTQRLWPAPQHRPAVVLAVPGQHLSRSEGLTQPSGGIDRWADEPTAKPWAATRAKKYLAGSIAVGTIDQALLATIKAKHAHLRLACLSRHLLVVDEVHASDLYMETLLGRLLAFHKAAGGHALLLSATLGARARAALLGSAVPDLEAACAAPYPALSRDTQPSPEAQPWQGRAKTVTLALAPDIDAPASIVRQAAEAARAGAKVLVLRNTRRAAIATFEALRQVAPDAPVFTCAGVPTLHHGRFAREDRALLDAAIETQLGKTRPEGGLVVIGTQTLEQSLDIDADWLITDLCPADVLLQRIGRLHRHERPRPQGFEAPRVRVLAPDDLAPLIANPAHGMGTRDSYTNPYPDLVMLEATRRLIEAEPRWTIPAMNRLLVEGTTHPVAMARLGETLVARHAAWQDAINRTEGGAFAHKGLAGGAVLRTDLGFDERRMVFDRDDPAATRLGLKDVLVELDAPVPGPFGQPVATFALPAHWFPNGDPQGDLTATTTREADGTLRIGIGGRVFSYSEIGLLMTI